jgi:hypothetical protein
MARIRSCPLLAFLRLEMISNKWLAKPLRQPLTHQAPDYVGRAAGGGSDDDAHRPRWIGLRPCDARYCWERGRARGQMQEFPTGKFHLNTSYPALLHSITSSASASNLPGISRPSALAVLRLITKSNFVDCWTGKLAGFSPLRMRPAYTPARRYASVMLVP